MNGVRMTKFSIRQEVPDDIGAIYSLLEAAFCDIAYSDQTEAEIVMALRDAGALTVSLVAEIQGNIVGYIAVSPVTFSGGGQYWYGLGPVAVVPVYQGRGVGSRLIEGALENLQHQDAEGCVVLGEPNFYGRFGFQSLPQLSFPGVTGEYFQALPFTKTLPAGEVQYHPAFALANA
jgi:putative acetyltransferase